MRTRCRRRWLRYSPPCRAPGGGGKVSAAVQKELQQAEKFYGQAQQALKNGDLGAYGRDIAKVKEALDKARQAAGGGSAAAKGRSPAPTPSASPTR